MYKCYAFKLNAKSRHMFYQLNFIINNKYVEFLLSTERDIFKIALFFKIPSKFGNGMLIFDRTTMMILNLENLHRSPTNPLSPSGRLQ